MNQPLEVVRSSSIIPVPEVPQPGIIKRQFYQAFSEMGPGDSLEFNRRLGAIAHHAYRYQREVDGSFKFVIRRSRDGYCRIWRTK
jgi:hypothetical protein